MDHSSFPQMDACSGGFTQNGYMMEGDFTFSPSSIAAAQFDPLGRHSKIRHLLIAHAFLIHATVPPEPDSHQLGIARPSPPASGMGAAHLPTPAFSTPPSPRAYKHNRPLKPSPTPTLPIQASSSDAQESTPPPSSGRHPRQRRFPCPHPGCERSFTSEYTRRVHVEAHQPKEREVRYSVVFLWLG